MKTRKADYSTVDLINPSSAVISLENVWFWCDEGNIRKGIMYKKYHAIANKQKEIAEKFPMNKFFPNSKLIFVEKVFVPIDLFSY